MRKRTKAGAVSLTLTTVLLVLLMPSGLVKAQVERLSDGPLEFSCPAFPADLSEEELIRRYGVENVVRADLYGADNGPQDGTVVFPEDPDIRLEIFWYDPGSRRRPSTIRARGEASRWTTPNGISVGADLLTIEQANGWPFRLSGFTTEGQGIVRSWGRGRLIEAPVTDGCSVRIQFWPKNYETEDRFLLLRVSLAQEYSSGHPTMQELNPAVFAVFLRYQFRN